MENKRHNFSGVELVEIWNKKKAGMNLAEIERRMGLGLTSASKAYRTLRRYVRVGRDKRYARDTYLRAAAIIKKQGNGVTQATSLEPKRDAFVLVEEVKVPASRSDLAKAVLDAHEAFSKAMTAYVEATEDDISQMKKVIEGAKLGNWTQALRKRFHGEDS